MYIICSLNIYFVGRKIDFLRLSNIFYLFINVVQCTFYKLCLFNNIQGAPNHSSTIETKTNF